MKTRWLILAGLLVVSIIVILVFLGQDGKHEADLPATRHFTGDPIRIGLIPERDIYALRKRNQILASYLSDRLGKPVELVTCNSYETILDDFAQKRVEVAFLGSLVAILAADRLDAKILLKTELPDGISSYRGVICVPVASSVKSIGDLRGRSIAMVRTTTAGQLFPTAELFKAGLLDEVRIIWIGTHDDAIAALVDGRVDAAGVKDLRLKAWQQSHSGDVLRVIATSAAVPENTLVVRGDISQTIGRAIAEELMAMQQTEVGRKALAEYGAARFLPCDPGEYDSLGAMVASLDPVWSQLGIAGAPPRNIFAPRK